jgi:hypothetical protein
MQLQLPESWNDEQSEPAAPIPWIWNGYLAPGQTTLLTGLPKTGKTTLLSHLLAHRHANAAFLERPVRHGVTVVITEETRAQWDQRRAKLAFGPNLCFFYRPFPGRPTPQEFDALLHRLLELHASRHVDLVVFDPLTFFLPFRSENPLALLESLTPLRQLTEKQMAVLLMHHPAKERQEFGQAARGSHTLPGFADILLELHPVTSADLADRRRLLIGRSRSEETPNVLVIELNEAGTEYKVLPQEASIEIPPHWPALQSIFEDAKDKLTRLMILDRWPPDYPKPGLRTLCKWLDNALKLQLVACSGTGMNGDPFRYWLPSRMQAWLADELWCAMHGVPSPSSEGTTGNSPAL